MSEEIDPVKQVLKSFSIVRKEGKFKLDAIDEVIIRTGYSKDVVIEILDISEVYELKGGTTIEQDQLFDTKYSP